MKPTLWTTYIAILVLFFTVPASLHAQNWPDILRRYQPVDDTQNTNTQPTQEPTRQDPHASEEKEKKSIKPEPKPAPAETSADTATDVYSKLPAVVQKEAPIAEPVEKKPASKNVAVGPRAVYAAEFMGTYTPTDSYNITSMTPAASNALTGMSGLVCIAGIMLAIGKPRAIVNKFAQLLSNL